MYWGLSEALDLYEQYLLALKLKANAEPKQCVNGELNEPTDDSKTAYVEQAEAADIANAPNTLNILLFGGGDPRHIIRTMAKLYKHEAAAGDGKGISLNICVLEGCAEVTARLIALLSIALEHPTSFNLLSRTHLFMDLYGNSLLRPTTHQYLVSKCRTLIDILTDAEQLKRLAPFISLSDLKYRERDALETAFNFWLPKESYVFDINRYWDERLRKLLGTRYDYRKGAFDWDLNMSLKERGAQQICPQEYCYWRETGIAFTYPEYEQCKPNKTLSVGLVRNGDTYIHRGYLGDIQTGPFCTFGLKTSDERLLHSAHGQNDYRATDITERNLLELFHELLTRTQYEHDKELSRKYGSVKLLMGERLQHNEWDGDAAQKYDKPWIQVNNIKIEFLSTDNIIAFQQESTINTRWLQHFDIIFVAHNYFPFLKQHFVQLLRENGVLILESKLFSMERQDKVTEFEEKLKTYAKDAQLQPIINYNVINAKNSLLKYKKVSDDAA